MTGNQHRILVIDDEQDIRSTMERLLTSEGYSVKTAANGNKALELLAPGSCELIITDICMPGLDGMEFMKKARKVDEDLEFIVLTGFGTVETAVAALRDLGAFEYLMKPLHDMDAFLNVVGRALERKRLRNDNRALIGELTRRNEELETRNRELQKALNEIDTLRGIIPICANCRKIRDDEGYWNDLEAYMAKHSQVEFSHGLCPECMGVLYPKENFQQTEDGE